MKEKKLKKQNNAYQQPKTKHQPPKGITLVALVITVIILLILAGVALSMITGEDGLFAKANNAATKYNEAAENESDNIATLTDELDKYANPNPQLQKFKKIIANAITTRGIETNENDSADVMANNIKNIKDNIIYPYVWGSGNACNGYFEFSKIRNTTIYIDSVSSITIYKGTVAQNGNAWTTLFSSSGYTELMLKNSSQHMT